MTRRWTDEHERPAILSSRKAMLAVMTVCSLVGPAQATTANAANAPRDGAAELFRVLDDLAGARLDRRVVERTLHVALKPAGGNGSFAFFEGAPGEVGAPNLVRIEFREPRPGGGATAGPLLILQAGPPCLGLPRIRERYGSLALTQAPSGHSAIEETGWSATIPNGRISFGFAAAEPGCLSTAVIAIDRP